MDDLPARLIGAGMSALVLAIIAWWGDRRRMRRSQPDAVGFMPWTAVFFWSIMAACLFLGLAAKAWLTG